MGVIININDDCVDGLLIVVIKCKRY